MAHLTQVIAELLPEIEYPTFQQYANAIFRQRNYQQGISSYLSSSTCGMLELYLDYCSRKNNDYVEDFDQARRVYLSHRSAFDNTIELVRWFEGNTEAMKFKRWMEQN